MQGREVASLKTLLFSAKSLPRSRFQLIGEGPYLSEEESPGLPADMGDDDTGNGQGDRTKGSREWGLGFAEVQSGPLSALFAELQRKRYIVRSTSIPAEKGF